LIRLYHQAPDPDLLSDREFEQALARALWLHEETQKRNMLAVNHAIAKAFSHN